MFMFYKKGNCKIAKSSNSKEKGEDDRSEETKIRHPCSSTNSREYFNLLCAYPTVFTMKLPANSNQESAS